MPPKRNFLRRPVSYHALKNLFPRLFSVIIRDLLRGSFYRKIKSLVLSIMKTLGVNVVFNAR